MGDLVDLDEVRATKSPHYQCKACGGEWWVAHVKIRKDLEEVTGWKIEGMGPGDSTPMCSACGDLLIEQVIGDEL